MEATIMGYIGIIRVIDMTAPKHGSFIFQSDATKLEERHSCLSS